MPKCTQCGTEVALVDMCHDGFCQHCARGREIRLEGLQFPYVEERDSLDNDQFDYLLWLQVRGKRPEQKRGLFK